MQKLQADGGLELFRLSKNLFFDSLTAVKGATKTM